MLVLCADTGRWIRPHECYTVSADLRCRRVIPSTFLGPVNDKDLLCVILLFGGTKNVQSGAKNTLCLSQYARVRK